MTSNRTGWEPVEPIAGGQDKRPAVGTIYRAADGDCYRIAKYEQPFGAVMDAMGEGRDAATVLEEPVYDYWSRKGGAAGGIHDLPEDAELIWPRRRGQDV